VSHDKCLKSHFAELDSSSTTKILNSERPCLDTRRQAQKLTMCYKILMVNLVFHQVPLLIDTID